MVTSTRSQTDLKWTSLNHPCWSCSTCMKTLRSTLPWGLGTVSPSQMQILSSGIWSHSLPLRPKHMQEWEGPITEYFMVLEQFPQWDEHRKDENLICTFQVSAITTCLPDAVAFYCGVSRNEMPFSRSFSAISHLPPQETLHLAGSSVHLIPRFLFLLCTVQGAFHI